MEQIIKLPELSNKKVDELLPDNLILLTYRGSIAHGMYVPKSDPNSIDDRDIMGIFINPLEHYLGFNRRDTFEKWVDCYDAVYYELRKLIILLMNSNPNVLSMLWVDRKHIIFENVIAKILRENRDLFVSKQAYHSFTGYAYSQLKRMENFKHNGYMGEKRKQLVEKFGYDTKNAAHLIRLLYMGIEFLNEGKLYVERVHDAKMLLDIKKGEWSLEQVKNRADRLFVLAEEAYTRTNLPNEPDRNKIEKLLIELLLKHHDLVVIK